jgi:pimeloyl-ACP methyl ester carboxylesterase
MGKVIEKRELFVLNGGDAVVRGTFHRTHNDNPLEKSRTDGRSRVGVLLINSLSPTRAGKGDSSVYWADSFAEAGYPTFRIDLPGFGDSDDDPPKDLLAFINRGGYAKVISAKAKEIRERFNISGVVLMGLCAGAVSAIYAAPAVAECRGLILLDPYFNSPMSTKSKTWGGLRDRLQQGSLRRLIKVGSNRVKAIRTFFHLGLPPSNFNAPLLACWKQVASTKLPIIIFRASTATKEREGDYINYILEKAGQVNEVALKTVEGADHTFANRVGRMAIKQESLNWLNTRLPPTWEEVRYLDMASLKPELFDIYSEDHQNSEKTGLAVGRSD